MIMSTTLRSIHDRVAHIVQIEVIIVGSHGDAELGYSGFVELGVNGHVSSTVVCG